jgi:transcriptional regulator with XRE-family HTH domain
MAGVNNLDPVALRRRLSQELRRLRQENHLTQAQVAQQIDWSVSKVLRIELGSVSVSTLDLKALLRVYQVDDSARIEELVSLARASRRPAPWVEYRDILTSEGAKYLGFESSAIIIRQFEAMLVPALLQTDDYALTLLRHLYQLNPDEAARHLLLRGLRQEILDRADPPELHVVLDESVIRRPVGGVEPMCQQLEMLMRHAASPGVNLQILPLRQE